MSDLLDRLQQRRVEKIGVKAWVPPSPCPPGYEEFPLGSGECRPIKGYVPPPPEPTPEPLILGPYRQDHVNVQNILRLKVQMGNEYAPNKGWFRVNFPEEMLSAHVTAISGPRSVKMPRADIVADRRENFLIKTADITKIAVRNSLEDAGLVWIMDLWDIIINTVIDLKGGPAWWATELLFGDIPVPSAIDVFAEMFSGVLTSYSELVWDNVVEPMWREFDNATLEKISMWGLADAWGIERGRSIHNVNLRNITGTSFEWYSYGEMYINWIAIGMTKEPQELPPEIQQPIDDVKGEINEVKDYIKNELDPYLIQLRQIVDDLAKRFPDITIPELPPY